MTIQIINTESYQSFSLDSVQPVVLYQSENLTSLLICVEAGQKLSPCVMSMQVLYVVLSGSGQIFVANEEAELKPGSLVVVRAGDVRSIKADERMRVLAIQIQRS